MPTPPPLTAFEAPGEVLRRRPDVRVAEASLIASTARIKGAQAELLPMVQLGGVMGSGSGLAGQQNCNEEKKMHDRQFLNIQLKSRHEPSPGPSPGPEEGLAALVLGEEFVGV